MHQYSDALEHKTMMRERTHVLCRYKTNPDMAAMGLKPLVANVMAKNGQMVMHWSLPNTELSGMQPGEKDPNTSNWNMNLYPVV